MEPRQSAYKSKGNSSKHDRKKKGGDGYRPDDMKRARKRILLVTLMCGVLFALTSACAFASANNEQPIDNNNAKITVQQGYAYGSDDGVTVKITSENLTEGVLVIDGYQYELNKEYNLPDLMLLYNNYDQLDPYDHFLIGDTKYGLHILSKIEPGSYEPAPPLGEWMGYTTTLELVPAKMPVDVVFHGETTINCYVGDNIMSNQGLTADDNGEDVTSMISGEKVDTSKAAKATYSWYIAGRSGNLVTFTRTFIIQAKQPATQPEPTVTPTPTTTTKPAVTPKAKTVKTTVVLKGSGSVKMSGPGKCHKKKNTLWIKTAKGKKVTLKAKGKKFKYWQKKVGKKYKKYSKKKTIIVKASKNTTYRAVFKK